MHWFICQVMQNRYMNGINNSFLILSAHTFILEHYNIFVQRLKRNEYRVESMHYIKPLYTPRVVTSMVQRLKSTHNNEIQV